MTENQFSEAMAARRESAKIDDEASKALAAIMTITVPSLPPYARQCARQNGHSKHCGRGHTAPVE